MRRYWIVLVIAAAVLALVFWPHDRASKNEEQGVATIASDADVRPRDGEPGAAIARRMHNAVPRLPTDPEDAPPVILDDRPKLPHEPWDVYHARLRLVKHWDACRRTLHLSEDQERAILLALYDNQQNRTEVWRGDVWRSEEALLAASDENHDALMRRLKTILRGDQWHRWRTSHDCAVLPIWADDGALRLPGDSPEKLYGEFAMEPDSDRPAGAR